MAKDHWPCKGTGRVRPADPARSGSDGKTQCLPCRGTGYWPAPLTNRKMDTCPICKKLVKGYEGVLIRCGSANRGTHWECAKPILDKK
jgi:hypothetical protein